VTSGNPLPPFVTFTSGAALLADLKLVESITAEGLRYISRSKDWPFGEGRPYAYGQVGNAKTMATEPFLDYFRKGPPRGGRGRRPSKP
jgi:hypothetical protein